jgi:hypothetical protein
MAAIHRKDQAPEMLKTFANLWTLMANVCLDIDLFSPEHLDGLQVGA